MGNDTDPPRPLLALHKEREVAVDRFEQLPHTKAMRLYKLTPCERTSAPSRMIDSTLTLERVGRQGGPRCSFHSSGPILTCQTG